MENDVKKVHELIESRRSIREFKTDPIPQDVLNRIMGAACWAPSAMNKQPWKFYVLTEEMRYRLANLHQSVFDGMEAQIRETYGEEGVEKRRKLYSDFGGAPVAVVCFTDIAEGATKRNIISASLACENLVLAAWAEGIGSLMMTSSLVMTEEISYLCGVDSDKQELVMVILLGIADEAPEAPERRKKRVVFAASPGDIRQ